MKTEKELNVLTEEEIACVTGGMEKNQRNKVSTVTENLCKDGVLSREQAADIKAAASTLSEIEFHKWLQIFAAKNNLGTIHTFFQHIW